MMKEYYWVCPNCGEKIIFSEILDTLFDEDGKAVFMPEFGVPFYLLGCPNCDMSWDISISEMFNNEGKELIEINLDELE